MTTVLLALGDPDLRAACEAELSAGGIASIVLTRPLALLSLAAKLSWDAAVVDSTPLGYEALATLGPTAPSSCIIGLGFEQTGVGLTLPLPLAAGLLKAALGAYNGRFEPALKDSAGLSLDAQRRLARANGDEVALTRTEYRLLELLRQHQPRDVSLDEVLESIWGSREGYGTAELVRTHIRNLRGKLRQIGLSEAITSRRGRGYSLAPGS